MNPLVTKPAAPEPSEREKFESRFKANALDFIRDKDAWGNECYYHAHIEAMWAAWKARAALKPAVPEPDSAQSSVHQVEPESSLPDAADTARLDFVINARTSWYPGRAANREYGILCYGNPPPMESRAQAEGMTMRDAIDAAMAASGTVRRLAEADEQQSAAVPAPVEPTASPMRIWIDTEFNEHARRHELISLALVADDGKEWYEVLPCQWPGPWVAENVMPRLGKPPVSPAYFAETLREFLAQYEAVHVIGDWPTDIALFCDALIVSPGCRIDTPPLTFEVIRLDGESADPHNALADARGIRDVHRAALNPKRPVEGKS